ncbi:MAG: DsrE family protein [Actinomycetota bacterium]
MADNKVLIGLTHGADEQENVLIAYLMGVEALRAGKESVMWLTKDGVNVAVDGFADTVQIEGAPSVADLHAEYVERGGRFFACPVCVKLRGLTEATWAKNVEVLGAPSVYEYTSGGALVFNY